MAIQNVNSHKALSRTLYKALLRTAKHYTSEKNGPVLSCLLYRSGYDESLEHPYEQGENVISSLPLSISNDESKSSTSSTITSTTSTTTGTTTTKTNTTFVENIPTEDRFMAIEQARDLSKPYSSLLKYQKTKDKLGLFHENKEDIPNALDNDLAPLHVSLYRKLVKEVIGSGVHMNFPSKIKQERDNVMTRMINVIKREFRGTDTSLSKSYSEKTRQQIAFLTLKELQKKLVWAESLGLHLDHDEDEDDDLDDDDEDEEDDLDDDDDEDGHDGHDRNPFVARNVVKLPLAPSSCYLQPGTFLIAHPLMTGCFARSVICLLQHTPPSNDVSSASTNVEQDKSASKEQGSDIGGTYGLIVNQPIKTGVPNAYSERSRWKTLREVIRYDCLPEGIKVAFGNSPVRNGGPVNLSVQMLRCTTPEEEEKSKIGGSVLPMATTLCDHAVEDTILQNNNDKGTVTTSCHDMATLSTAMDTNSAVYFGGDIIKAAQAVIDGDIKQDSISFLIGASCWESGQLESEVEKGYWIPCSAPPEIAYSGLCDLKDIHDVQASESSLWVSMMAAIGEEEGRLAQIFEDFEYDENGYPCDEI